MTHDDHADDSDGIDPAQVEALLAEYRAAVEKIDATVAQLSVRAEGQLACRKGCAQCCVAGLSVLPVEALAIEAHAAATGARAPAPRSDGHCAFLDDTGACSIYAARPVLCRTHGLAMRGAAEQGPGARLAIVDDDVSVCALNYTERAPAAAEILDANKVLALLVTVDRRFREKAGLPDDASRVPLADLADALRG